MDFHDIWIQANKLASDYPLITSVLTAASSLLSLFVPKVRIMLKRFAIDSFQYLKSLTHRFWVKICFALDIARLEDLDRLRSEFKSTKDGKTLIVPPQNNQELIDIYRGGLKVRLSQDIRNYLAKEDPHQVSDRAIDRLIHGPFCASCSYLLLQWNSLGGHYLAEKCAQCGQTIFKDRSLRSLVEFKRLVYRSLDAEVQQTGKFAESDGQELV